MTAPGPPIIRPDVLVLGAGGTLGEAWMTGVLAGIEAACGFDLRETESLVGTSAGAIVAARLAAGRRPRPPARSKRATIVPALAASGGAGQLERLAARLLSPASGAVMRLERIPGGLARGGVLALLPEGTHSLAEFERSVDRLHARFDGRLRVACVERRTGRRVVFGAPGAPPASVAQAVAASCAIPGYFRPARIGGREYVDGAAWSMANIDAAPAGRRTEVLCLSPTAGLPLSPTSPLGLLRTALRSRQLLEVAALGRRGARLRIVGPAAPAARLMAPDPMNPTGRDAVLRAGYAQGLALGGPPGGPPA
jgi:NTE family protein